MNKLFKNRFAAGALGIALAAAVPLSAFAAGPGENGGNNHNNNGHAYAYGHQIQTQAGNASSSGWLSWFGFGRGDHDGDGDDSSSTGTSTVSTSTTNMPPAISGISSPTVLQVGQTGTWSVRASDPQNGNLTYSVDWGDTGGIHALIATLARVFTQTTTFTHSYGATGVYTVTFTVKDSAGLTTTSTVTVNVISSTSGPVILNVNATSTTPHQAILTWNTNENSDSEVWYSTSSPVTASGTAQVTHTAKVFNHSVTLTGLSAGTIYYAIVGSKDSNGNLGTSSQATFTTPGTADTKPPVITSITGSSTVVTGTQNTWTVNAYDPKNEALSYTVNWGDGGLMPLAESLNGAVYLQSSTFSHTYANPGMYTITFTAKNTSGLTTTSSTTVTVEQLITTGSTTSS